ncbi:MAG: sensor histidine kinase, partial [Caulobacteraceae bacterium]
LRTPLNAINGFSEIMVGELFGPLGDPRYAQYSRDILASGEHLLALINDVLDMAKIEAGKLSLELRPLSLEEAALDAIAVVRHRAETAGLSLEIDFPPLPLVAADPRALKQVLLNLLSNAIKFTPRGGKVRLTGSLQRMGENEAVSVSVIDTGIGVAPEDLPRLMKPFEQAGDAQARGDGTGLGLALCKSLVEIHGGNMELQSRPGEGLTARFVLPTRRKSGTSVAA